MSRSGRAAWLAAGAIIGVGVAVTVLVAGPSLGPSAAGTGDAADAMPAPTYVDETATSGIDHAYEGEFDFFVGGGVSVFDCDKDGRGDLYVAGGSEPAALFRNESPPGGSLHFDLVSDAATDLSSVTGAYPVDIDGDRLTDLAVLRLGENVLLRGLGDCRFERANEAWGFDGGNAWTTAFSAAWEGDAGLPTLAIGDYVARTDAGEPDVGCSDNTLVRPGAPGAYGRAITLAPGWCALSMLFSDWDRSGRRDLRISNDRHYYREGEEQLWRVDPGASPRLYTRDDGWERLRIWGMGIASQDLTGDGYPEVYLTSQSDNKLQTLAAGPASPTYEDVALERGALVHQPFVGDVSLPSTAWHAEFDDVNADGFMDLFVSKGNVEAMPDYAARDPNNLLLGLADGTFVEAADAAGIVSFARARGAAVSDLNLDGMLDLVVVNRRENVTIWRNVGAGDAGSPVAQGHWIALRLDQPTANHAAIGSWIEVKVGDRTITRELTIGGGHAGGELGWTHFGLGRADHAEVRVQWPDGTLGPWLAKDANTFGVVERGASQIRGWVPPAD